MRPHEVAELKEALKIEQRPAQGQKLRQAAVRAMTGAVVALLIGLGAWQWLSPSPPVPSPLPPPDDPEEASVEVFRDILQSGGEGPEMVALPTGSFRMGDLSGDGEYNEKPTRTVILDRPIAMGKYEVTVGEFRRFVTATAYQTEAERNAVFHQGCATLELMGRNKWDWTPGRVWSNLEYTVQDDQPVNCISWNDARRYIDWLNEETQGRLSPAQRSGMGVRGARRERPPLSLWG